MKIKKNGKTINLTESDLKRIVKRTLNEQTAKTVDCMSLLQDDAKKKNDEFNDEYKDNPAGPPIGGLRKGELDVESMSITTGGNPRYHGIVTVKLSGGQFCQFDLSGNASNRKVPPAPLPDNREPRPDPIIDDGEPHRTGMNEFRKKYGRRK